VSQPLRVLLVEDSEDDALLLFRLLRNGGYEPEIRRVATQCDMQAALDETEWDIIISDYSMPGFDGLTALKLYHEAKLDIPFILVSGTIGEEIAVEAMRAGAHDYLMKDNLVRLVPAVQRELHEAQIRHAHRQAQEALHTNEKKYRLLVEHAPSGIYEIDLTNARFISVNEVMCEYTGYTKEEFLNLDPAELLTEENRQRFLARYVQMQKGEHVPETVEYQIRGKNGKEFWVNLQTRMTWEDDKLKALVVAHDITERKLAEESLRRYAERLSTFHKIDLAILAAQSMEEIAQAAINHIRQLVPCLAASAVLFESHSLEALLFVTATDQPIGIQPGIRFALERYQEVDRLLSTLSQGEVLLIEDLPVLADEWPQLDGVIALGMRFVLLVPLLFQNNLLGFIGLGAADHTAFGEEQVEITREIANQLAIAIQQAAFIDEIRQHAVELEERVAERTRELQLANEHLEALSRVKDEFVSNVSHELRTPITNMMMYHSLISSRPEQQEKYLDVLKREICRLSDLIEDLLFLSRLDQDRTELRLTLVDLNTLVSQYVEDRRLLTSKHGLELFFTPCEVTPIVLADESLVSQVFSILLTNATNYTPAGGRIDIAISQNDDQWGISVSDTGPGIEPGELDKVFERFFRGAAGRASTVAGTGLGLSIAKEIVERHQGEIEVRSSGKPGEGATFVVWLPSSDR
jgi:PAS domain S-box-containing protein